MFTDFRCTQWAKHRHFGHARDISFRHPINFYFGNSCFSNIQFDLLLQLLPTVIDFVLIVIHAHCSARAFSIFYFSSRHMYNVEAD